MDKWEYLSPLFGEWLEIYPPKESDLKPYPRNLEVCINFEFK